MDLIPNLHPILRRMINRSGGSPGTRILGLALANGYVTGGLNYHNGCVYRIPVPTLKAMARRGVLVADTRTHTPITFYSLTSGGSKIAAGALADAAYVQAEGA